MMSMCFSVLCIRIASYVYICVEKSMAELPVRSTPNHRAENIALKLEGKDVAKSWTKCCRCRFHFHTGGLLMRPFTRSLAKPID